ncbi:methionine ABC transporter ATP-binding protein [Arthrobacter zhaoguopingii]|uniref:methionine ABC transporter ATP-binding protein n=1 Tax=Arthrobacter zhaoguopingii TaxID=2681491 RepID=UPI001FEFE2D6|nr:ATP-binding cassette domain-containing protein [Arthrobacter zhaoguopingii]
MISLLELTKTYGRGADSVTVLDRLNFEVGAGEIFAVTGPSGAGKSTLAQCINLLERPTSGSVVVNGEDLSSLPEKRLRAARRRIGTVFQSASLLSRRTASENIALPLEYLGVTPGEIRARVGELIDRVGLGPKAHSYPFQLSGGQAQRVGIARALALRPAILLADEATSGLDPDTTSSVVELLKQLRTDLDLTVVFITHEMDTVRQIADSVARLERGRIVETGALVDLLTDHGSPLGRRCSHDAVMQRPTTAPPPGTSPTTRPMCRGTGSSGSPPTLPCRYTFSARRSKRCTASIPAVQPWGSPWRPTTTPSGRSWPGTG